MIGRVEAVRCAEGMDLVVLGGHENAGELRQGGHCVERVLDERLSAEGVEVLARDSLRSSSRRDDDEDVFRGQRRRHRSLTTARTQSETYSTSASVSLTDEGRQRPRAASSSDTGNERPPEYVEKAGWMCSG